MPSDQRVTQPRSPLLFITLVALALRLVAVAWLYPGQLDPQRDHWAFGYEAGRIAHAMAQGEGFSNPLFAPTGPTAWMAPVYPGLLWGVFKLFGIYTPAAAIAILSLNSLFSALTCIPVFCLGRHIGDERVARWAAWVWAVFPYAIYFAVALVWETSLTVLLFSLLVLMTLQMERATSLGVWAGFGTLSALAALTNPVVLSVLPCLGMWSCYRLRRQGLSPHLPATVAALTFVVAVAPWFLRNHYTFHQFIPFRDNLGLELHVGNNGDTSHWAPDAAHPSTSEAELEEYNRLGELAYMARKRRQALTFIAHHPAAFAWLTLRRVVYLWTGFWSFDRQYLAAEGLDLPNIPLRTTLTVLALLGLRRTFKNRLATALPLALIMLAFPLIYYVTTPQAHYRHPADPLLVVLAVYALVGRQDGVIRCSGRST